MAKLGFGKYKDLDISEVPESYLQWLINNSKQKIVDYEAELKRREQQDDADATWIERLVKTGWRELTKRHHPDVGGSTADMQEINAAYEALRRFRK